MVKVFGFVVFAMFVSHSSVCAKIVAGDEYGPVFPVDTDTVIMDTAYISTGRVDVISAANLENYGVINSDIYVCAGCDFFIRNAGAINGQIYLGHNANMVQYVYDEKDLTHLNVDSYYTLMIDGARDLSWNRLFAAGADAGHIVLHDAAINLDDNINILKLPSYPVIEIQGNLTIMLPSEYVFNGNAVLRNITGDGGVIIDGDAGRLHAYSVYVYDSDLYIDIVRETDYFKILGDDLGRALNSLRMMLPDDKLLAKLDSAQTMDELMAILSHSVAVNPYLLSEPIRLLDGFIKNFVRPDITENGIGLMVRPFYLSADDTDIYGAVGELYLNAVDCLHAGFTLYGADILSYDSINEFSAYAYGMNFNLAYLGDYVFARTMLGMTHGNFDVPYIFSGDSVVFDMVSARSKYAVADAGININLMRELRLMPYVGAEYEYVRIENIARSDVGFRTGMDVVYSVVGVDLQYDYKVGAARNTFGEYDVNVGIAGRSPIDGAGIGVNVGLMHIAGRRAYVFSVSASAEF